MLRSDGERQTSFPVWASMQYEVAVVAAEEEPPAVVGDRVLDRAAGVERPVGLARADVDRADGAGPVADVEATADDERRCLARAGAELPVDAVDAARDRDDRAVSRVRPTGPAVEERLEHGAAEGA